jgi:hypothetical protein
VDKAGRLEACTVCLPAVPDVRRQVVAAAPDAQQAVVAAAPAQQVAAAAPDAQQVAAAEPDAQQVAALEPDAQQVATVVEPGAQQREEAAVQVALPREAAVAAQQLVAAWPALQPGSEWVALRVPAMLQQVAAIWCRRAELPELSV